MNIQFSSSSSSSSSHTIICFVFSSFGIELAAAAAALLALASDLQCNAMRPAVQMIDNGTFKTGSHQVCNIISLLSAQAEGGYLIQISI